MDWIVGLSRGSCLAIVNPWCVAFVSDSNSALAERLRTLAALSEGSFDVAFECVLGDDTSALPDFALVVAEATGVQLLVRGRIEIHDGTGDMVCNGAGFRTWNEMSIDAPEQLTVRIGEEEPSFDGTWTSRGVVRSGALAIEFAPEAGMPSIARSVPIIGPLAVTELASVAGSELISGGQPVGAAASPTDVEEHAPEESEEKPLLLIDSPPEANDEGCEPSNDQPREATEASGQTAVFDEEAAPSEEDQDPAEPVEEVPSGKPGYSHLFGMTQARTVEEAAVRPAASQPEGGFGVPGLTPVAPMPAGPMPAGPMPGFGDPGSSNSGDTDHDGHTKAIARLREPNDGGAEAMSLGEAMPSGIPAARCANGHLNPPHVGKCHSCPAPILDGIAMVERAIPGHLVFPGGRTVNVDRRLLIGRNPVAEEVFTGEPPLLIPLPDDADVSRTHLAVEPSGWTATVVDLGSLNGTMLRQPGREPEQLRAHLPAALVAGAEFVLADVVKVRFVAGVA